MNTRQRRRSPRAPAAGFTLVELLVGAIILAAISALSFPTLVSSYEEQKLRQAAIELQSKLLMARTLAQRLQGRCGVTISNVAAAGSTPSTVLVSATPAASFSGTNSCTSSTFSTLDLQAITNVRGLSISNSATTAGCSSPACALEFIPLGVRAGTPQTFFLSGTGTTVKTCVAVSLAMIRVGFLNSGGTTCDYTSS